MPGGPPANKPELPGRFLSTLGPAGDNEYVTRPTGTATPANKGTIKVVALAVRQPAKAKVDRSIIAELTCPSAARFSFTISMLSWVSIGCLILTCKPHNTSIHSASQRSICTPKGGPSQRQIRRCSPGLNRRTRKRVRHVTFTSNVTALGLALSSTMTH